MRKIVFVYIALVLASFTLSADKDIKYLYASLLISIPLGLVLIKLYKHFEKLYERHALEAEGKAATSLTKKDVITAFVASVLTMTFMSTSSPLYPFNYWNDADLFLTVGKSVKDGIVLYRDIYEQKGPVLYFIHALCAYISDKTFFGVYLLEILMCFVFLIFARKLVRLFIKDNASAFDAVLLFPLCAVIYSSNMFHMGDSAEEICFPLLTAVLYFALKALQGKDQLPSWKESLITGIISGALFWTKYNMCAFIAGFIVFFIVYSIVIRKIRIMLIDILSGIAGFLLVTVPVLLYFKINDALSDLYKVYFYNNLFLYNEATNSTSSLYEILHKFFYGVPYFFGLVYRYNHGLLILLILSVLAFGLFNIRTRVFLLSTFVMMLLGAFSGRFVIFYYGFILMTFVPIGLTYLTCIYREFFDHLSKTRQHVSLSSGIIIIIISLLIYSGSKNLVLIGKPYSDTPQAIFAEDMSDTPDAKILTYDIMDMGFFIASGNNPSNKFFSYLNIEDELPELRISQDELISDKYFDYIITDSDSYTWNGYELADHAEYVLPYFNGRDYTQHVFLYRKCISR